MNLFVSRETWFRYSHSKRAFVSLIVLITFFSLSLVAELFAGNRPLLLLFEGEWFFPVFRSYEAARFGDRIHARPDYRWLRESPRFARGHNYMWMPVIPYSPEESMKTLPSPPPCPPSAQNWMGTDDRGRDLLTRLIYGFRNSMLFGLFSCALTILFAFIIGGTQALCGKRIDFVGQRITETWHALPLLYVVLFLSSLFSPTIPLLTLLWVLFTWVPLSQYVRAEVLKIRRMDYVASAEIIGAGFWRILFFHILPNAMTPILTFAPFLVANAIVGLAALDYLGLGLAPPAASWGELLRQAKENLTCWWLVIFPLLSLFATLCLLNAIGEGVQHALGASRRR